ncbi:MAG: hypothetical protein HUU32_18855 [Calditrichaceae bacterium]|nr:hypothetical protein [Calditrichia bacterium]NUQ43454.1 hypothetical protein [Calditrichaceae bacterium]
MMRSVLAVIAGVVAAGIIIALVEMAGQQIYPLPEGVNPADPESVKAAMANIPTGGLLFVLLAWALGSFGGGWLAARIAGSFKLIKLTEQSLVNLKSEGLPIDIISKLKIIKDIGSAKEEEEFWGILKATIGDEQSVKYKLLILKHALVTNQHRVLHGMIVGGIMLLAGIVNMAMIPHPLWFWVVGVLIFLPAAYLGARLGIPKTAG